MTRERCPAFFFSVLGIKYQRMCKTAEVIHRAEKKRT